MNDYSEVEKYYDANDLLYKKLVELNQKRDELKELKRSTNKRLDPLIITVSGTPRSGKTTCINNLYDFFKKASFKTTCVMEPAGLVYATLKSKEEKDELLRHRVDFVDKQFDIGLSTINNSLNDNNDIIICDRGIIDTFIWYNMYYNMVLMDKNRYETNLTKLNKIIKSQNYFYALTSTPLAAMKRDYQNSLCLEPRSTVNEFFIEKYNASLNAMYEIIKDYVKECSYIDTTALPRMDASIQVASNLTEKILKLYK